VAGTLGTGDSAVVATGATDRDGHISVKICGGPAAVTLVASCAIGGGGDVIRILAGGFRTIVTGRAISGSAKAAVVSFGTLPFAGRFMAALATRRCGQMAGALATGDGAVVATGAPSAH